MSIEHSSSAFGPNQAPPLDAFRKEAEKHDAITLTLEGESWQVRGVGAMPDSGRQVAWVQSDNPEVDTTSEFVNALSRSFSAGISKAVTGLLDLQPSPGKPLSSRTVSEAIDMASTGAKAISGVDFFTRLQFSAASGGAEFQRVRNEMGLANKLDMDDLKRVDSRLDQEFAKAQENGTSPITYLTAEGWLREALASLHLSSGS